jgi:hypothetical protein
MTEFAPECCIVVDLVDVDLADVDLADRDPADRDLADRDPADVDLVVEIGQAPAIAVSLKELR